MENEDAPTSRAKRRRSALQGSGAAGSANKCLSSTSLTSAAAASSRAACLNLKRPTSRELERAVRMIVRMKAAGIVGERGRPPEKKVVSSHACARRLMACISQRRTLPAECARLRPPEGPLSARKMTLGHCMMRADSGCHAMCGMLPCLLCCKCLGDGGTLRYVTMPLHTCVLSFKVNFDLVYF